MALGRTLAIGLCCAGTLGRARADSLDDSSLRRELAGHVFFPSLVVANPFLSTHLALFTAAGYDWIEGPDFDAIGNLAARPVTRERSYAAQAIAEGVTFQANVTDYLAIRIAGGGGLEGGSNGRSALVVGAIQPITAGAGATLGWSFGNNARLGFTFDFVYTHFKLIQPLVAIQDSLAAGRVQASSASEKLNDYSPQPGFAFAIAPSPTLGVLASAQYSSTSLSDTTTRHFQFVALGASGQVDLGATSAIPIGLLLSYRATIPFESDVRFTHTLEGGVFYTGRKELDLGLDVQAKWFDLHPEHRIRLDTTQLIGVVELRYHWN